MVGRTLANHLLAPAGGANDGGHSRITSASALTSVLDGWAAIEDKVSQAVQQVIDKRHLSEADALTVAISIWISYFTR